MKNVQNLAIYLDYLKATLFNFKVTAIEFKTFETEFNFQDKKDVLQKGESHLHNKEQHLQQKYYASIGEEIVKSDQVLLFGPTDAKTELFNFLMDSNWFNNIRIKVKASDKLTENQQLAFVNKYFSELK